MATVTGKSFLAVDCKPGFQLKVGDSLLSSREGCAAVLNDLLETAPTEFGSKDLAVLNLICAPTLSGSETLDIPECLAQLKRLTEFVRASTQRNLHRFPGNLEYGHSEPKWRMSMLITKMKRDFGAAYNPTVSANRRADVGEPLTDSRDVFIHGLLDGDPKHRWGTCASIPVLVTAVARRLGYPVGLAVAGRHIYARWEGGGTCFNIEASNPMGMVVHSDEHYRQEIDGAVPGEEKSGYYLRMLFPAEEFALFLTIRVEALVLLARYEETLLWSARALQFAPEDPRFPYVARNALDLALKHRLSRIHPEQKIPPPEEPCYFEVGDLVSPEERSLYHTIIAHYSEAKGELDEARVAYEEACRQNFHGNNEQRDLQRFLREHGLPRQSGPLLPPKNLGFPRRITPLCRPEEEAATLRRLAAEFERNGELVKARDALHDLYMFDPSGAEVFNRARAIEERPRFQEQFRNLVETRRRILRQANRVDRR